MYYRLQIPSDRPPSQFIDAFDAIHKDTRILDLSESCLNNREFNTLISAFKKIPTDVTVVDLSCKFIFTSNSKCPLIWLASVIKLIKNITELKLRNTDFENMSPVLIRFFLLDLPNTLTTLDLSNSSFYKERADSSEIEAFSIIFQGISPNITSVNLSNIKLSIKLVDMLSCLPEHVRKVSLAWSDIENLSKNELIALGTALPNAIQFEVLDKSNRPVAHEKVDIIKLYMGKDIMLAYKHLVQGADQSLDEIYETLSSETKTEAPMIREFIQSRQTLEHAELVKNSIKPSDPKEKFNYESVALLTTLFESSIILMRLGLSALYPSALSTEVANSGKKCPSPAKLGLFKESANKPEIGAQNASHFGPGPRDG